MPQMSSSLRETRRLPHGNDNASRIGPSNGHRPKVPTGASSSIAIIDSRAFIRTCLSFFIGEMLRDPILGFSSFEEWLADPGASETDLVLYSVEQGDEDDMLLDDLRQMVQAATGAKIVVTSNHHDPMIAHEVLAAGARGYIPNSMPDVVWMQALNFVRVGGVFAPPPVAFDAQPPRTDPYQQAAQEAIACGVLSDEPAEAVPNRNGSGDDRHMLNEPRPDARPTICFTPRELEVVKALRDGQSNKIIAYTLDMSESTVKVHIRNVMKKLRARNRTEVAVMVGKMLVDGQLDS